MWIGPRTWVAGEVVTAPIMNQHIRDNFLAISSIPAARVTNSIAEGCTTGVSRTINFDTEAYDTDTIHDNATNNDRLVCKTAGKYLVFANIRWQANTAGSRQVAVQLNGTTNIVYADDSPNTVGGEQLIQPLATVYQLAVNDYLTLLVLQTSGGSLQVEQVGNYSPIFGMHRLSD